MGYPDLGIKNEDGKIIIERIGQGSLPLPLNINVEYKDSTVKILTYSMEVWKDGKTKYSLEIENMNNVISITLDTTKVPDIDHSNNELVLD